MREFGMRTRLVDLYNGLLDDYFEAVHKHVNAINDVEKLMWYDKATVQAAICDGVARAAGEALGVRSDDFILACYKARGGAAQGAGKEVCCGKRG